MSNKTFHFIYHQGEIYEVHHCFSTEPIGEWERTTKLYVADDPLINDSHVCWRRGDYVIPMTADGYKEAMDWLVATDNYLKIENELSRDGYSIVSLANHLRKKQVDALRVKVTETETPCTQ